MKRKEELGEELFTNGGAVDGGRETPVLTLLSLWETIYVIGSPLFDSQCPPAQAGIYSEVGGRSEAEGPQQENLQSS